MVLDSDELTLTYVAAAAAYVFGIAVYITVTIPTLRTIVTPVVGVDTDEDRAEALRVLSAGNTIIILCLGAILALQVGIFFSEARGCTHAHVQHER